MLTTYVLDRRTFLADLGHGAVALVVATPGHTAGSISVLDAGAGILVAGDALRTDAGKPSLPGPQFTVDMAEAKRSIVKLGGLSFETLLPGHGDPIERGASALVAQLGASA